MTEPIGTLDGRWVRIYFAALFAIFVGTGSFGALWLSDEFDAARELIFGVAIPSAVAYFASHYFIPGWRLERPIIHAVTAGGLLLTFAWGNVILLNAIGAEEPVVVALNVKESAMDMDRHRGAFGIIYRKRW